jgi:tetratricopeptide (TPR) repeat protein
MSFRKLKRAAGAGRSLPDKVLRQLQKADDWMDDEKWDDAYDLLSDLNTAHPNRIEIVTPLALACYHLEEISEYLDLCIQLNKLTPGNPDNTLALASAYLMNHRIALAYRTARHFLERWPHHPEAENARSMHRELENATMDVIEKLGLPKVTGVELAALHEESQFLLERGKFAAAIVKASELLRQAPGFKVGHNNLSLMYFYDGQLARAIAHAEETLKLREDDYHALSNLVHFHLVAGREDEARQFAERLKQSPERAYIRCVKQAEAMAILGDHQGVLDALRQARKFDESEKENEHLLLHLAAVAEWKLGRPDRARALWRECLDAEPGFGLAEENLEDSLKPAHKQNGPWYFSLSHWLSQRTLDELRAELQKIGGRDAKTIHRKTTEFLGKHPEILRLMKQQFASGSPEGRDFVTTLATMAKSPESMAMLREFALGQHGSDELRMRVLHILRDADFLPQNEPIRVWSRGKWEDVTFRTNKIYLEARGDLPPKAEELMQQAFVLLRKGDGVRAEPLIKQALEFAPESLTLRNNLAMAYHQQNRIEEANNLTRELFAENPDYFFGRLGMANLLIQDGKYDEAEELLHPLHSREEFHISEITSLYATHTDLNIRKGNRDEAERWIGMLEELDPESQYLEILRRRLRKQSLGAIIRQTLNR